MRGDERRRGGNRAGHCEQPAVHGAAANPQLGAATNFVHFYAQTSANSIFVHILCIACSSVHLQLLCLGLNC